MSAQRFWTSPILACLLACSGGGAFAQEPAPAADARNDAKPDIFARSNLVAWCIVPFDSKNRSPAERAEMLQRLGLRRVAYDWRENHVATFEEEIRQYARQGIEYFAFWGTHDKAFELFAKHRIHPQIWQMLAVPPDGPAEERVAAAAKAMLPLVERTRKMGCQLAFYNHGGWGGDPENMVAVCRYLRERHDAGHVGIVYNLHHAHNHIDDFAAVLKAMQPYLLCLNLNGMATDGEARGQKILPLGAGEHDLRLLKIVRDSGYAGPIGIIGHTQDDVEQRLRDNLDGLDWLRPQLDGKPAGSKPKYRTYAAKAAASSYATKPNGVTSVLLDGKAEFRVPPITVECRATLASRNGYNILVASDTKQSAAHWELFTMAGSGHLTAYLPGMKPDHARSNAMVCDGRPHVLGMVYEADRVRLYVDGKEVADQKIESLGRAAAPGGLAIGRLVEGGLGCDGRIDWVRIARGAREILPGAPMSVEKDTTTLLHWQAPAIPTPATSPAANTPEYSPELVARLIAAARKEGDALRGVAIFSSARSACLQCHKIGRQGGNVGPELTGLVKQRKPEEIVEGVLWPQRTVRPEFVSHHIETDDGRIFQGYVVKQDDKTLVLRDPTRPGQPDVTIPLASIDLRKEVGTLMPNNLAATMTEGQLVDLLRFLLELGGEQTVSAERLDALLAQAGGHTHAPAKFDFIRDPLDVKHWPGWELPVNRARLYDFYAKQADHFRQQPAPPALLAEFPGLDGGKPGHWGNQNDTVWANDRWNHTDLGSLQSGVFHGNGLTVPRGVCVRLGEQGELSACFNAETLTFDAVWSGGFVKFSPVRHGFMGGLILDGTPQARPAGEKPTELFVYHGFYRHGKRVLFAYRIGKTEMLDAPWVEEGRFTRVVAPFDEHPLRHLLKDAPTQWPQTIETAIELGSNKPYAVDTIGLPTPANNPWKALVFCGGHGFLPDGSAVVCTMQGDVWRVTDFAYPSKQAKWRRIAAGLHQALGLVAGADGIYVLGRDQITRLRDLNGDGETDFYECFSNAYVTSPAGHDFICGLERDAAGNFYTASGNQGLLRISPTGERADVLAFGFRNPDGIGLLPDGTATVPCSEGDWTPASMICAIPPPPPGTTPVPRPFKYPAAGLTESPALPMVFLPRGLDNSSGGQTVVESDRWGPLKGQMLHFSYGAGSHFLVLRDEVQGHLQGAVVPLPGEFRSGAHRGRFSPADGQLYVSGMQGWGSYTPEDGCFHRVRYTGDPVQLPVGIHTHENGVAITFSAPLDQTVASSPKEHFAQCWNYRYSGAYGSPEFSTRHYGVKGHDRLEIASATILPDGQTLFLAIPDLQPVNQLHLRVATSPSARQDLFVTVHKLDAPFTNLPNYQPTKKTILPHPIFADMTLLAKSVPNPNSAKIAGARSIKIETAGNLSFATRSIRVKAGEPIALTLENPDVVPHNWALLKPGSLERVGEQVDRLISDPDAIYRHYIPDGGDVLAYADVTLPGGKFTLHFRAPETPGRYPYLCTFPGHWKVMNGEMIVEAAK